MTALPKFRLNKQTLTDDKFQAEVENKVIPLQRGTYDIKIIAAAPPKADKDDASWVSIMLTIENSAGHQGKHFLKVPTEEFVHKGPYPWLPAKTLTNMFAALGETFQPSTAQALLTKYVGNDFACKGLIGKSITVTTGYRKNYIKYVDKNTYEIVDKDGYAYKISDTEYLKTFNSFDEAKKFAKDNDIKLSNLEILKFEPREALEETSEAVGDDFGDFT